VPRKMERRLKIELIEAEEGRKRHKRGKRNNER
jgi:hypothetical protein